jgi:hypothetical protein
MDDVKLEVQVAFHMHRSFAEPLSVLRVTKHDVMVGFRVAKLQ